MQSTDTKTFVNLAIKQNFSTAFLNSSNVRGNTIQRLNCFCVHIALETERMILRAVNFDIPKISRSVAVEFPWRRIVT